ncbi:unnamed protein product [Ilex paraguariensis]|uniref:Cytochrome P450 n=1 Tax=Ilex paraguariensis TaxID=185542 RepID=A0ABC8U503_9AQUA
MDTIEYLGFLLLIIFFFLSLCFWIIRNLTRPKSSILPTNWPFVGMMPGLLQNVHHVHDYVTEFLKQSGQTFVFKGPWFANVNMVVTCEPANVHHILSRHFPNYPKGSEFNKIFDILGDGIFNSESELWETHRRTSTSLIHNKQFLNFLERTTRRKVEDALIPFLNRVAERGTEIDLQELFHRLTFDSTCTFVLGHDLDSLSIDSPNIPCEKAFGDVETALFFRHILPERYWKLQRWLQIGTEKKMSKAWETLDQFLGQCIALKRKELRISMTQMVEQQQNEGFDLLTAYMKAYQVENGGVTTSTTSDDKFLRDTLLSLVFASRDTTSSALTWFFWLIATHPLAETNIREEIKTKLLSKGKSAEKPSVVFTMEELSKLVYLHGALCESLRLFPPVPLQHKSSLKPDIFPSGHSIDGNTKIVLSFYSMGRMESIWGKDCMEFKPERWITDRGGIKHEPSFKFVAFGAGPRSCLGKNMSFLQMKIVAATIIFNYHVQLAQPHHPVSPSNSVILHMKDGLKVKVTKLT